MFVISNILRISFKFFRKNFLLFSVFLLAFGARLYKLNSLMPFIGDQAWFYLQARDILIFHKIPFLGIASSHVWLHQGPLWTYLLALVLFISNFNPIAGGYLTVLLDSITVFFIYNIVLEMFSRRTALIASLLYASSPAVILYSRMPYHTSLIPFFIFILLLFMFRVVKGNSLYFIWIIFILAILYNFELATVVFLFILIFILFLGLIRKDKWTKDILEPRILFFSLILFLIPMFPVLFYDSKNGFSQTIGFSGWLIYSSFKFLFVPLQMRGNIFLEIKDMLFFFQTFINKLFFIPSNIIASLIFILSLFWLMIKINTLSKKRILDFSFMLLSAFIFIPLIFVIVNKVPSEAYLPMFIPGLIIMLSLVLDNLIEYRKIFMLLLLIIVFGNLYFIINSNYLVNKSGGYGYSYLQRLSIARKIIGFANKRKYNLIGSGEGSSFESFTANYEYLTWYLGNGPSKRKEKLIFVIKEEHFGNIILKKIGR